MLRSPIFVLVLQVPAMAGVIKVPITNPILLQETLTEHTGAGNKVIKITQENGYRILEIEGESNPEECRNPPTPRSTATKLRPRMRSEDTRNQRTATSPAKSEDSRDVLELSDLAGMNWADFILQATEEIRANQSKPITADSEQPSQN
ncbi:hypothetical protein QAD02_003672 [Eretmocerus hayati]|uniref:Uncharacterized protein n=1 Tax=Eretmocerus hayati TaxID=131215 RepID=A0ACC2NMH3_9HYME|nr:hypothetical protein QAD02_003672 [Eretmocerus hayati]